MADEDDRIADHRAACVTCEMVREMLKQYDFDALIAACQRAGAVAPILDPTLWMQKGKAMEEDEQVFRAARAFLKTWEPKR